MPTHSLTPRALSRRAFLRNSALVTGAAAAGTLLTACGSSSESGGGDGNGSMTYLSILPLETLAMAPELLGVAGGYFAKHGLDVELQPVKGTAQAIQTLISGIGPVCRAGQIDLMTTMSESQRPLIAIGTLYRGSGLRILYSKSDPLTKPEDFVGKTIGVPSEGGTSSKVVSLVLASGGFDPAETPRQVTGLTPGTFNLVQQGRIGGYVASIDTSNIVLSQHEDAGVFDPGTVVKSDSQVYLTTTEVMEKDPDTLKAFMAAIRDSIAAFVADENFDETIAKLREQYSFATLDDDVIARKSLGISRELWTGGDPNQPLLVTHEDAWLAGYQELVDAGVAKPGGDASSWFDNSLLPDAKA
ncbi:ABC-type nitrate/sulfonate/bicarbonate transport system, periplasmic component [Saccharomonospora marina XMU15]|uniref:ABC-type nitrate/sulfonate/bicarbonate transport system, periplasmic component n=1 Tax=Saccharomonospora marina XMU15 TaxID=882083 RepID=H5WYR0_9PSEU|nr:ABC transporter substrate-binding protein [Saccharomonospora marina]EHR50725.1 ABC-type nitrate/sulfonate/bicarbonate transport system, periplasmic component [Saccharomonospora marina XMU15]